VLFCFHVITPGAFPLDLFGFERYIFPTGGGWSS